jgi:hypothetical protein
MRRVATPASFFEVTVVCSIDTEIAVEACVCMPALGAMSWLGRVPGYVLTVTQAPDSPVRTPENDICHAILLEVQAVNIDTDILIDIELFVILPAGSSGTPSALDQQDAGDLCLLSFASRISRTLIPSSLNGLMRAILCSKTRSGRHE